MSDKNKDEKAVTPQATAPGVPGADTQAGGADGSQEPGATSAEKKAAPAKTEEPKVSDTVVKIGKSLLKNNPAMPVVYMTSDGRGFYELDDADNHAKTLNDKAVTPVKK